MVISWYMNDDDTDQRMPHHRTPPQYVLTEELKNKCGVLYWQIDADNYETEGKLSKIREERGYTYSDVLECSPDKLPNYCEKLKTFFTEHLHADEEIRFVIDGSGYFDVRDDHDEWIRIKVVKGDLLALPAGIYHRFTLDDNDYIKVIRLFIGKPVWTPINRPADDHPARQSYVSNATKHVSE